MKDRDKGPHPKVEFSKCYWLKFNFNSKPQGQHLLHQCVKCIVIHFEATCVNESA